MNSNGRIGKYLVLFHWKENITRDIANVYKYDGGGAFWFMLSPKIISTDSGMGMLPEYDRIDAFIDRKWPDE